MATASTSPRGSKPWPMPAGCSSPTRSMTTCATGCPLSLRIWASSRSRTSPGRCGSIGFATPTRPTAAHRRRPPALPLPDKPSIAVLPFANMSGDPEQEYFADGMVEEIITALSRIRWLFVIARNSSFAYKGQAIDVKQVGRELGVRYVLEGSVRKAGRSRAHHRAADRHRDRRAYLGRPLRRLARRRLRTAGQGRDERRRRHRAGTSQPPRSNASSQRPTQDLTAYDLYLRALPQFGLLRKRQDPPRRSICSDRRSSAILGTARLSR